MWLRFFEAHLEINEILVKTYIRDIFSKVQLFTLF